jgi:Ribbon-helix-helix protein, copG family
MTTPRTRRSRVSGIRPVTSPARHVADAPTRQNMTEPHERANEPDNGHEPRRADCDGRERRQVAPCARVPVVAPNGYGTVYGMERTTVYLTERQKRALERSAKAEGRSEAELIREGVDLVTSRLRAAEARLPLFESGQPDLASRVDEELAGFGE